VSGNLTFTLTGPFVRATDTERQLVANVRAVAIASKDFSADMDLPPNTFNKAVGFQAATIASFLLVMVSGGDCVVTLTPQNGIPADHVVGDTLLITGTALAAVSLTSVKGCRVLVYGGSNE
jgi:hypothetical protein